MTLPKQRLVTVQSRQEPSLVFRKTELVAQQSMAPSFIIWAAASNMRRYYLWYGLVFRFVGKAVFCPPNQLSKSVSDEAGGASCPIQRGSTLHIVQFA